jgi:hypothetical protein
MHTKRDVELKHGATKTPRLLETWRRQSRISNATGAKYAAVKLSLSVSNDMKKGL